MKNETKAQKQFSQTYQDARKAGKTHFQASRLANEAFYTELKRSR